MPDELSKTIKESNTLDGNMAGFLGKAPLTSDIALLLEIAVIIALFVGRFRFARNGRIKAHGFTVMAATTLHAVSVLLIMIPSLARSVDILFKDFFSPVIIVTWIHVPLGLLTLVLAAYLVSEWRFRSPNVTCYRRTRLMRPLWLLWVFSLVLGLLIHAFLAIFA